MTDLQVRRSDGASGVVHAAARPDLATALPRIPAADRGGLLLATTHGEFAARWWFGGEEEAARILRQGFFDGIRDENLGAVASGDYYKSTFQTREWTQREWGKVMPIVGYECGGMNNFQDVFVLRKPQ